MEQEYKYMVCTVCSTFNHAPYIVDAMNGFTMQETTFPVYYLITDDASTDGEPEVIKRYLADHFQTPYRTEETDDLNLICAIHKTNLNCIFIIFLLKYNHRTLKKTKLLYQTEWRNNAKYIAVCEGDDYWTHPKKLQIQVDFLENHQDYSMCYTDVKDYYQKKNQFGKSVIGNYNNTNLPRKKNELFYYILLNKCRIQTCTVLYRGYIRNLLKKNECSFMMGDTNLWIDFSQWGPIKYIPEKTGVYRIVCGSASRNPKTLARFNLSMFEMRVYYCNKYGYEIPSTIKRSYNKYLVDACFKLNFAMTDALYPLFPMNVLQTYFLRMAQSYTFVKVLIEMIWHVEDRLYNK